MHHSRDLEHEPAAPLARDRPGGRLGAAERAVEHLEAIGCSADDSLISPVGRP